MDTARALTAFNFLLPATVLGVFLVLRVSGGAVFDRIAPVMFWLWVVGAPVVGGLAIRSARRAGAKGLARLNSVVLVLWGVALLGALMLH